MNSTCCGNAAALGLVGDSFVTVKTAGSGRFSADPEESRIHVLRHCCTFAAFREKGFCMADKTELAEDRTNLAEDRTVLANERTFAGWLRTGFASIGIGLGFHVLFEAMRPPWVPKAIATAFLLIGVYVIIVAERRAARVLGRMDAHKVSEMEPANLRVITLVSVLAAVALIAAIWLLEMRPAGAGQSV
jgi:putative membrane protein